MDEDEEKTDKENKQTKRREATERRTTGERRGRKEDKGGGEGGGGGGFTAHPPIYYESVVDRIFENPRNVTIRLPHVTARSVRLQLFFALRWMLVSEVAFESGESEE